MKTKTVSVRMWISMMLILLALTGHRLYAIDLTGNINSHDPGALIKDGNRYFHFTTGTGIWYSYSDNLTTWTPGPSTVFPSGQWPSWINSAVPGFSGQFWAPEAIFMNGAYYLYYSCSTFGSSRSAIGVVRSTSLTNPSWTDLGVVVQSNGGSSEMNAIDPALFRDSDGRIYLSYGSWFGGIGVFEIDPATGKRRSGSVTTKIAGGNGADWEAPFIFKEGSFYYLMVNRGNCCQGVNSTYRIVMGRSSAVTGPYVDQGNVNLNNNGGTTILSTSGKYIGPGHFGLLREGSCNYVSVHYYDGNDGGNAKLDILRMTLSNGWPSLTRSFTVGSCGTSNNLTVSPASLSLASGSGSSGITVTSNVSWTVTDNQTWISVSPASGSNNGIFTVSVTSNGSSSRSGTVTVSGGSITRTISVTQSGSSGCTPTTIVPQTQINGGSWVNTSTATVNAGASVSFGPQPTSGGSWSWTGPNSYTSTSRQITINNVQSSQAGNYIARHTNASGCQNTHTFTITVNGGGGPVTSGNGYYIQARHTVKNLTNNNSANFDGALITSNDVSTATIQRWTASSVSGGFWTFRNQHSNRNMEIGNASTADGANLIQWPANSCTCQQWSLVDMGGGYYQIRNRNSNKCVTVVNGATHSGATVQQWPCGSSTYQQFRFISVSGSGRLPTEDQVPEEDAESAELISVYPNPVAGNTIEIRTPIEKATHVEVKLITSLGSEGYAEDLGVRQEGLLSHTLDVSGMKAGAYVVMVRTPGSPRKIRTKKIMIE